jgi:hypothetical protein
MVAKKDLTKNIDAGLKRSMSRRFNDVLARRQSGVKTGDRRSARRLNRYREELRTGQKAGQQPLSPLEIVTRVHVLLESGVRLAEIRQLTKPRLVEYDEERVVSLIQEMQPEYGFRAEAYRFAGVRNETLFAAGLLDEMPAKRGPKAKNEVEAVKPIRRTRASS